jgi:hypothetical protein
MWRSKKFIIIAVLTILVLGGTLGGVAIAQANNEDNNASQTANVTSFLGKVAEVYQKNTGVAIDPEELQKAVTEARQALKDEALDNYLQKLVTDGKITQEQADQFKTWLDSRPTFPTDEFKTWWDARPDIPTLFGEGNGPRMGPFGGMHGGMGRLGGGFGGRLGGWCAPDADTQ